MDSPSSSLPAVINTNAVTGRRIMKAKVGLWIDHRQAIIVVLTEKGEETKNRAGHDAWVVGDKPFISIDFGDALYAKQQS
jgi:hypothetical protein